MRKIIFILLAISIITIPSHAQRRKKVVRKTPPKVVVEEETPAEKLFKSMLPATAKIMFIDSIVVEKHNFQKHLPVNNKVCQIKDSEEVLSTNPQTETTIFLNEFGARYYYADGDTLKGTRLYSIDRMGETWGKKQQLSEIDDTYVNQNYPVLLNDGITLLFAAQGENSLGGYDIFMTLLDNESGLFYKPENYGLPFNSTANDYMVVFDEFNEWGWLVSDRYQPEDKVCIYTFVPTSTRSSYREDELSQEKLISIARLTSIKDTWKVGNREGKLAEYHKALKHQEVSARHDFSFAINDNTIYHSTKNFKTSAARKLYTQLQEQHADLSSIKENLEKLRAEYSQARGKRKEQVGKEILSSEAEQNQLMEDIAKTEKQIRILEN